VISARVKRSNFHSAPTGFTVHEIVTEVLQYCTFPHTLLAEKFRIDINDYKFELNFAKYILLNSK
jgi:hypothetical protein